MSLTGGTALTDRTVSAVECILRAKSVALAPNVGGSGNSAEERDDPVVGGLLGDDGVGGGGGVTAAALRSS